MWPEEQARCLHTRDKAPQLDIQQNGGEVTGQGWETRQVDRGALRGAVSPQPSPSPLLFPLSLAEREQLTPGWTLPWAVLLGQHKPLPLAAPRARCYQQISPPLSGLCLQPGPCCCPRPLHVQHLQSDSALELCRGPGGEARTQPWSRNGFSGASHVNRCVRTGVS